MNVKMLKTFRVSPDGISVETVLEGQQKELPLDTAKALIRDKIAVEVKEKPVSPQETKTDTTQDTKKDDTQDTKKV